MSPAWIVLSVLVTLGAAERFACKGRILGAYYADSKSGCKAFHVCVRVAGGGIRDFRFFCPPGTLFHQEAQTCTDWGDDDPLACPPDLYDGSFDLYKIGSGYDTKKQSASAPRDEEAEFGLQRAETGDRRLQNQNSGASDLRAAHSSDFFSGQRDRGRDDAPAPVQSSPATSSRQSFRRPTTARTSPAPTTLYTPTAPPPTPKQYTPKQYTPQQYSPKQYTPQQYTPQENTPQQYTPQQYTPQQYTPQQYETSSKRKLLRKRPVHLPVPTTYAPPPPSTTVPPSTAPPQQKYRPTPPLPANVPPQYKEEYVEVPRVTPKQPKFLANTGTPAPFTLSSTATPFTKKEGLVELFNYDSQSTPALNIPNRPFKVRNSFSVTPDFPREQDFVRTKSLNSNLNNNRNPPSTVEYSSTPRIQTTNAPYRNFNSVSYETEKNNFISLSGAKQNYNYFNSPSTTPSTTTYYTTTRDSVPQNLNTVAYNTNNGINSGAANFVNSDEDDGQYRPPQGEDDGQYRPELYEREKEDRTELLSGAHSLNIAASGNRLPEDQKQFGKGSQNFKAQTAAPRPFRPAPTPTTTPAPEPTTTFRPQTVVTQRTFDYYKTYTTTSAPVSQYVPSSRPQTTQAVARNQEPVQPVQPVQQREQSLPASRPPVPTAPATKPPSNKAPSQPTTRAPHFAHPAGNKEDNSYDYAYYDSDPGFAEYDAIEEFGKTKSKA